MLAPISIACEPHSSKKVVPRIKPPIPQARQKWEPQSYQVGSLVKTIPLGPGETRKYTSKTVVKKSRNAKELNESLRSDKKDSSETRRDDCDVNLTILITTMPPWPGQDEAVRTMGNW